MNSHENNQLEAKILAALELHQRGIDGALHRLANRIEQRARRQAQMFAEIHFGKGKVPPEITDLVAKIWLD